MELKIASAGEWRPAALGGSSGVHKDILEGRDCEIGWEDVFTGEFGSCAGSDEGAIAASHLVSCGLANEVITGSELRQVPDFHTEIEHKMKMNW